MALNPAPKGGYKAQQIQSTVSLGASQGTAALYDVNCETDALGLAVTFSVTTLKGTGIYASGASVLSALAEAIATASDKKTVLHDFKTPNVDISRLAFMFDSFYGRGGYWTPDVAISADGTNAVTVNFWGRVTKSDFPLKVSIALAALSAIYSTTGTGTATLTTTITPIKSASEGVLTSDYSFETTLSGLTAINNDVTAQLPDKSRVKQLGIVVGTESHLTDVTLTTPEVEIISMPTAVMKQFDTDTISGHQTGLFRILFWGQRVTISKNGDLMKVNESTADQPTLYFIGDAR